MILGALNLDLEPVISLVLKGRGGVLLSVDAVVDTGFTAYLTLPIAIIEELGFPKGMTTLVRLADGSTTLANVYSATTKWNGEWLTVEAEAADTTPLVGAKLLEGMTLTIDYVLDGTVHIESIS